MPSMEPGELTAFIQQVYEESVEIAAYCAGVRAEIEMHSAWERGERHLRLVGDDEHA